MDVNGFRFFPGALGPQAQQALLDEVLAAVADAPFHRQATPGGKAMSVQMTGFGPVGWISDRKGYRYEPLHPVTGRPRPPIPPRLIALWRTLGEADADPDCCLVNLYRDGARMGLHQDRDEAETRHPVLSVSLGDTAIFRVGGTSRSDPTRSVRLASGDVCVLGGDMRLAYHGVDRVLAGSSLLIEGGGRINLTLRRALPAL